MLLGRNTTPREIEFHATPEDVLPILAPLFARGATAFSLVSSGDAAVSTASTTSELRQLIDLGATRFEVGVGDEVHPPLVGEVFNQPTGAMRYFFVDKVGGPFLGLSVPERRIEDGIPTLRPGAISTRSRYFKDASYRNEIPGAAVREAFLEVARRIKTDFTKFVNRSDRTWYFSRSVLADLDQGAVRLRGPLTGFETEVLRAIRQ